MKLEIDAASQWFASYLCGYGLNADLADRFKSCLAKQLELKFQNHWYEDQPLRGNGYRSVTVDKRTKMDGLLEKAASEASVPDLSNQLGPLSFVMWIDPFEVDVRFFGVVSETQVVYRSTDYKPPALSMSSSSSSSAANQQSSLVQNSNSTTSNTTTSGEVTPKSTSPPGSFNNNNNNNRNRSRSPPLTPPLSTSPTKEYVYNNTHYYNTSPGHHYHHYHHQYNNNNNNNNNSSNNSNTTYQYRRVQQPTTVISQQLHSFDWSY